MMEIEKGRGGWWEKGRKGGREREIAERLGLVRRWRERKITNEKQDSLIISLSPAPPGPVLVERPYPLLPILFQT